MYVCMQTESIAQNHTTNSYHVFNYVAITQYSTQLQIDTVGFNVPIDTFQRQSPSQSLDWCKTQSSQPITWLVLVNKIKQTTKL